ncbi:MAG: SurA N-terminal domain-containing protein [Candidatus Aerophobus sp.]|nr:MAG: SurA N-terminal domain-containing protein [Candidatus Aerophobus sp.]
MNGIFSFFVVFLIVIGTKFACGDELIDEVVAVVNGEIITQRQLEQVIFLSGENWEFEDIIEDFILYQEAEREGISVSSETVEKALVEIKADLSDAEFEQALAQGGLTVSEYKEWLRRKILRDRLKYQKGGKIGKNIRIKDRETREFYLKLKKYLDGQDISEAQVAQFYRSHKKNLANAGKIQIAQIIVKSKATADLVLQQLKKGESLAALARKFSLDNNVGGELGWISLREIKPSLRAVILPLQEGEVVKVKEEKKDFYRVIQLKKRKELDFINCEKEIEEYLKEERGKESMQEWLKELTANSEIRIIKNQKEL